MRIELTFNDIKIGQMFLWSSMYLIKTKSDFAEYKPNHEFYFHKIEQVFLDDECDAYNKGVKIER